MQRNRTMVKGPTCLWHSWPSTRRDCHVLFQVRTSTISSESRSEAESACLGVLSIRYLDRRHQQNKRPSKSTTPLSHYWKTIVQYYEHNCLKSLQSKKNRKASLNQSQSCAMIRRAVMTLVEGQESVIPLIPTHSLF
jgi:hypothetical protein